MDDGALGETVRGPSAIAPLLVCEYKQLWLINNILHHCMPVCTTRNFKFGVNNKDTPIPHISLASGNPKLLYDRARPGLIPRGPTPNLRGRPLIRFLPPFPSALPLPSHSASCVSPPPTMHC